MRRCVRFGAILCTPANVLLVASLLGAVVAVLPAVSCQLLDEHGCIGEVGCGLRSPQLAHCPTQASLDRVLTWCCERPVARPSGVSVLLTSAARKQLRVVLDTDYVPYGDLRRRWRARVAEIRAELIGLSGDARRARLARLPLVQATGMRHWLLGQRLRADWALFQVCSQRKRPSPDQSPKPKAFQSSDWLSLQGEPHGSALSDNRREAFEFIYAKDLWTGGSGPGSSPAAASQVRCALDALHASLRVQMRSLFDVVGDFQWMHIWLNENSDVAYLGIDIVPALVEHHTRQYSGVGKLPWHFSQTDLVTCRRGDGQRLMLAGVDIVLLRDVLQHNAPAEIVRMLACVSASGARWLLATDFPGWRENLGLDTAAVELNKWRWHAYDLTQPPYGLPAPVLNFPDMKRVLGLWPLPLPTNWLGANIGV